MSASGRTMNCEEYREAIAADPSESFDGGAAHAAGCEACAAFRRELRALDARIARALDIPVPALKLPELPAVGGDNVVSLPVTGRRSVAVPKWIAVAAGFALAAYIGVRVAGDFGFGEYSLEAEVLAHVDHEPGALRVTDVAVPADEVSAVVNPSIGSLDRDVGLITYARSCVVHGNTVPHLVMQGDKGPITLLLMPEEKVDGALPLNGDNVHGVILPVGSGSIAIVAPREQNLEEIEQRVIDSVEWSI